jgi:hypothetical protein
MAVHLKLPRVQSPLDQDDTALLGQLLIYSVLVLLAAALLGLAIRVFLWAAFGG